LSDQGDQIGRTFAIWANVNFGQFFEVTYVAQILGLRFFTEKVDFLIKNALSYIFWAIFVSQNHLVALCRVDGDETLKL
jgi:hypothetical protein